jgi:NTP pyrophosphatase (non-canonical NTP hydrolase)
MSETLSTENPSMTITHRFVTEFNELATRHHAMMVDRGFWEEEHEDAVRLMLMVTELAEACEAIRHSNPPDDKIPEFSGLESELADVILRIMDMAQARGLRVAEALLAKITYNATRGYKHGKAF